MDLRSILAAVLRRRKLVTTIPLLALILTYGVMKIVPSLYKSTTEILIFDPQRQIDEAVQKRISPFVDAVDAVAMNTEIGVIQSKSLALRVAKELSLDKDEELQSQSSVSLWMDRLGLSGALQTLVERIGLSPPSWSESSPHPAGVADELRLERTAEVLRRNLQVERVLFSYILAITVTSQDPVKAQRLAATFADDYLAAQREARQDALQRVASWLKGRVDVLQSRVLETEASIEKLKADSGLTDAGANNGTDQQIADLNTQLNLARSEVTEKRVRLEQARRLIENNGEIQDIPEITATNVFNQLRLQQSELSRREAELRNRLSERHAEVVSLRMQLAGINKAIAVEADHLLSNIKNAYDIAAGRQQSIETSLQKLTTARGNSEEYVKLRQLRRVADADRKLYESYLSQYNEISTRRTLQDASARIITPATLPDGPSSPRRVLFYAFAGAFGLAAALALVVLLEFLHAGVKTGAQVEQAFGCPVVGIIPLVRSEKYRRRLARNTLARSIVDAPLSQFSEAVHAMRIGLQLSSGERGPKVILITSSLPGEGKSTAAMLLAASSAGSGLRTVLVDCDLRRQSISEAVTKRQRGLAELLTGEAELRDVTVKSPATDVHVIPAGRRAQNPADLLMSQRMHELLARLRDDYDYIVVDSPPLLPVIDALALAAMVDKILVIVEWDRTPRASVSEAFKVLRPEAHRVAGIVLNKVDLKEMQGYGYLSYYNYPGVTKYS